MTMTKKAIMTALWRVQQAQMVISIIFWSLTLTGVFYPYIRAKWFDGILGPDRVLEGMVLMFLLVVSLIVMFGLVYDKLKFWKEANIVIQERNPYTYGPKMWPQNIVLWDAMLNPNDKEARKLALNMMANSLIDPEVMEGYREIKREVNP
jgi:hypothetical protein